MTNNEAYKIPEVIECVGYESLGSTEIRLDGLDSFIENAKDSKIDKIWSCYAPLCNKFKTIDGKFPDFERMDPYAEIFFFVVNNVIYSVESLGYRSLYDYINAKKMGFLDPSVYSLMAEVTKKYKVESVASLYYKAVKDGFKNLEDFADSFNFYDDYESFSTYQEEHYLSAELGFKKKYDWEKAESKGFKNGMEYYDAISLDIDNACDYHDYKILFEERSKYGFRTPFEFHLFHIINRYTGEKRIPIRNILTIWKTESFYYNDEWYSIKKEDKSEERLEKILTSNKKFLNLGKIENEPKELVLYHNDIIYVDGSNVAWNNGSKRKGDLPHYENIKIVVEALKNKGFTNVLALCDSNLNFEIDDVEIYNELVTNKILYRVKSGTVADEWILKLKGNKDLFIITNDAFKEFRNMYKNLDSHLVTFQVAGKQAVFDDKIESIADIPDKKNLLPPLCRQNH